MRAECERREWELVRVATDAGEADVLLTAKLDRVSRSVLDFAALMARADHRGWRIVVDANVDTSCAESSGFRVGAHKL